ncbi:glycosyltransferase [Caldimonas tepidiphila]|uniref:glycosyltransferase n=1 Tax=Caldimonas tepidiphila TaxID=2315841 RepID=UPI000E5BA62F|nr:glycosyltransferase [Caldimonas tepidiphila]
MSLELPVIGVPPSRTAPAGAALLERRSAEHPSPPPARPGREPLRADAAGPVVLVSHGFQAHYELGFANGLAYNRVPVTLLGSSTTLASRLSPGVTLLNIRGSQDPGRSRWRKLADMGRYHLRLLLQAWRLRRCTFMVIGMLRPEWLLGIVEGLLLRLTVRRLTLTVHNILPHDRHTVLMRATYWLIYRIPHRLVVHTEATRRALVERFGIPPGRIVLMEHGLNDAVDRLAIGREQARQQLGIPPQRCTGLFFGHVSQFKGLDLLLDALPQVPHFTLLVAGRCSGDDYGRAMRARLEALVREGRVIWLDGFVDEDTVARVFAAADCTVLPYRHIDQSGVLMLSLAQGVPVLATRVGGFTEVVHSGNGAFIDEPSADAIARALQRFTGERDRYRRSEVMRTVERLQWRRTVEPLVEWLREEGGRPASPGTPAS